MCCDCISRGGAKTVLVHDRPVLGGNASSEVRMWICGAHGEHNKETGILEEMQLENLYRNPGKDFSIWDTVLWGHAAHQPNLTLLLNTPCTNARIERPSLLKFRPCVFPTEYHQSGYSNQIGYHDPFHSCSQCLDVFMPKLQNQLKCLGMCPLRLGNLCGRVFLLFESQNLS